MHIFYLISFDIHICMNVCSYIFMSMFVWIYFCMYILYTCIYIHAYISVRMCVCVRIYKYILILINKEHFDTKQLNEQDFFTNHYNRFNRWELFKLHILLHYHDNLIDACHQENKFQNTFRLPLEILYCKPLKTN